MRGLRVSSPLWLWLFVSLVCVSYGVAANAKGGDEDGTRTTLYPDRELIGEQLRPVGYASRVDAPEKLVYELKGLQPNQHYEVRISYPGSTPSKFVLAWASSSSTEDVPKLLTGRDLLDTEKIMFVTDERGGILSGRDSLGRSFGSGDETNSRGSIRIEVTAEYSSVSYMEIQTPITFNIVLETLFHDIPMPVFRIVVIVVVSLAVAIASIPRLRRLIASGSATASSSRHHKERP